MDADIEIRYLQTQWYDIDRLIPSQGNLKSLAQTDFEKFKHEILEHGFTEPITAWQSNEQLLILNGHQRLRVLSMMRQEGYRIPEIPVSLIECSSREEAARICLALASQYGKVEKEGLYEYCHEYNIPVDYIENRLRLPEIDLPKYKQEFFDEQNQELKGLGGHRKCPECGFEF